MNLEHLKKLEAEATPGPWEWVGVTGNDVVEEDPGNPTTFWARGSDGTWAIERWNSHCCFFVDDAKEILGTENAALIIEARNALPILIEIAEAAKAAEAMLEDHVCEFSDSGAHNAQARLKSALDKLKEDK